MFLIEEPETGLHPARIAEVVRVLRDISQRSQVVLATHSPLVVNELEGAEVSVVTRTVERGTETVLLRDTPNYAKRREVYANGELWLACCDGQAEEALLKSGAAE